MKNREKARICRKAKYFKYTQVSVTFRVRLTLLAKQLGS